jgi:acyl carrier protein
LIGASDDIGSVCPTPRRDPPGAPGIDRSVDRDRLDRVFRAASHFRDERGEPPQAGALGCERVLMGRGLVTDTVIRSALAEYGRLSSDVSALGDDDNLFDAGLTSHASVNVMMAIEDAYELEFPVKFLKRATFGSIGNLRAALDEMLQTV